MKIQALAALLAVLLCVGFCSCRRLEETPELVTLPQGEGSPGGGTPTAWRSYSFPSYQMLEEALTGKDSSGFANLRAHQAELGAAYRNTLAAFEDGRIALAIPRMNGEPLALRNRFGFSNITLLADELYELPWIWYFCVVNGLQLDVRISYLEPLEMGDFDSEPSYLEVLNCIAPSAPNPDNYRDFETYERIYEKDLTLHDGSHVTALVSELTGCSEVFVMLYRNGMLVVLYGDAGLFDEAFWRDFSLAGSAI